MRRQDYLSIVTPKDKVFATAIRKWAEEKGITLEERSRQYQRQRLACPRPYICRNGHSCDWVYIKKRRGRQMRLCPTCADANEQRRNAVRGYGLPQGRPRIEPIYPYQCRNGHVVKSADDETTTQTEKRSYVWCAVCRRESLNKSKKKQRARKKASAGS